MEKSEVKTKVKMERLKIKGISSEEYPEGRIDSFRVKLPKESPHHSHIIPLFLGLGLSKKEALDKLDVIFHEIDNIFVYINPKIKAWLIVENETLSIKFDTSLPKEEINKVIKKYFEFPK